MFIQTESTPNPATMKFLPGQVVMESGTADFADARAAADSPLARRIFAAGDVERVFLGSDFIAVTKAGGVEWPHLRPQILGAILEHFQSGAPAILARDGSGGAQEAADPPDDDPVVSEIRRLIETRVRPAVAQDGGDITFQGFDRGIVYLHMRGACAGCPSATRTLKMGIENLLRHHVPEVTEVRSVAL